MSICKLSKQKKQEPEFSHNINPHLLLCCTLKIFQMSKND